MPLENCELHAFVPRQGVASAVNRSASVIDGAEALCAVDRELETPVWLSHINVDVWLLPSSRFARPGILERPCRFYITSTPFLNWHLRSHPR